MKMTDRHSPIKYIEGYLSKKEGAKQVSTTHYLVVEYSTYRSCKYVFISI